MAYKFLKALTGVYAVVNLKNGKMYVGSSGVSIYRRLMSHLFGNKGSRIVFKAISIYGISNFAFVVLEVVQGNTRKDKRVLTREDYYITLLIPEYNLAPQASSNLGIKKTPEQRELLRKIALDRLPMSDYTRALVSKNSVSAKYYNVSRVDNTQFIGFDGKITTSVVLRTINTVASFICCGERSVRRSLTSGKPYKGWKIIVETQIV